MQSSVTVTIHHATSLRDAASAGRGCGARGVSDTASASRASVTRWMGHAPAHQGTVGNSAGSHVLPGSTVKTAGTGVGKNLAETNVPLQKHRKRAVLQLSNVPCLIHIIDQFCGFDRK